MATLTSSGSGGGIGGSGGGGDKRYNQIKKKTDKMFCACNKCLALDDDTDFQVNKIYTF